MSQVIVTASLQMSMRHDYADIPYLRPCETPKRPQTFTHTCGRQYFMEDLKYSVVCTRCNTVMELPPKPPTKCVMLANWIRGKFSGYTSLKPSGKSD